MMPTHHVLHDAAGACEPDYHRLQPGTRHCRCGAVKDPVRCRYVTGKTRLYHPPLTDGERRNKLGKDLGDGYYEWLCGNYAAWTVIGPEATMETCTRDLSAVLSTMSDPVILVRIERP